MAPLISLLRSVVYFDRLRVDRVMTDNGSCYRSKAFADARTTLGIRHIRPYTPQTNGKAERFFQTALREWAYATAFETSDTAEPKFRLVQVRWRFVGSTVFARRVGVAAAREEKK